MTLRKHTMFDFCIMHDCSVIYRSCYTSGDAAYLFEFRAGYHYRYVVRNIDLIERDHRVLESAMLDSVEKAYTKWKINKTL